MWEGVLIAFIGYVFTRILMQDILSGYAQAILRLPEWLNKPLGMCGTCFTGWLSIAFLMPLTEVSYMGILTFAGTVALNMTIVNLLIQYEKD